MAAVKYTGRMARTVLPTPSALLAEEPLVVQVARTTLGHIVPKEGKLLPVWGVITASIPQSRA